MNKHSILSIVIHLPLVDDELQGHALAHAKNVPFYINSMYLFIVGFCQSAKYIHLIQDN